MPLTKYIVRLTDEERTSLEELIHTGTQRAAATLIHARILLKADAGPGGRAGRMTGLPKRSIVGPRRCIGCAKPLWKRV